MSASLEQDNLAEHESTDHANSLTTISQKELLELRSLVTRMKQQHLPTELELKNTVGRMVYVHM